MKNNKAATLSQGTEQPRESLYQSFTSDMLPGAAWTEFEDSFIQLLSGTEPAKRYLNQHDIHQLITC